MELKLDRKWKKEDYTVGRLYIDDEFFCNTMEDTDRGLDQDMQDFMIRSKKIPSRTAVPTGRYKVLMNTVSPKFSQKSFYMQVCNGKLPRLKDVKGFEGILIHCGNTHQHSGGCILVGKNTIKGKLTDSQETFKSLYAQMKAAYDAGQEIFITIM
jgi:hypothetical protein